MAVSVTVAGIEDDDIYLHSLAQDAAITYTQPIRGLRGHLANRFFEGKHVHLDRMAGVLRATHPDFTYQLIAEPEELGNGGRVPWVAGRLGDAPSYAGTDFIIARDGRIAAIYLFFDKLS